MPRSARFTGTTGLVDATRVGPPALAHNQSVYGALTRLLDGQPPTLLWLAVAGPLRSPSWSSAPAGGAAATGCSAPAWPRWPCWSPRRSRGRTTGCGRCRCRWRCGSAAGWAAAAWIAVFVARPFVWPPYGEGREYGWSWPEHLVGNAYLICAIGVVAWAAAQAARRQGTSVLPGMTVGGHSQRVVAGEVGVHGVPARGARQVVRQVPPRAVTGGLNGVPHGRAFRCSVGVVPHQLHERLIAEIRQPRRIGFPLPCRPGPGGIASMRASLPEASRTG